MIKLTATAAIYSISPVIDIPSKNGGNPFQKRELVLDDSWLDRENQLHQSLVVIEATGEKMDLLNQFAPGTRVTVEAIVSGREANGRVFNTIKLYNISLAAQQPGYAAPAMPQQPVYPQQAAPAYQQPAFPQPAYPQQAPYPQQPGYAPYPQAQPQQAQPQQAQPQAQQGDNLPF